jgi:hypothetical protein
MTNRILETRSLCDHDCIFRVTLVKMTEKSAFVIVDKGEMVRCKIKTSFDGSKYITPYGTYSMAPAFRL